jgi:uncharacterized protein
VSSDTRVALPFDRIAERVRSRLDVADLGNVEAVVAIARGGVIAGALCAFHLALPLRLLRLRYRDDANTPLGPHPEPVGALPTFGSGRILLVDDVSVTGATLRAAQEILGVPAITLVVKGRPGAADIVLFDDVPACVTWPWHEDVAGDGTA